MANVEPEPGDLCISQQTVDVCCNEGGGLSIHGAEQIGTATHVLLEDVTVVDELFEVMEAVRVQDDGLGVGDEITDEDTSP